MTGLTATQQIHNTKRAERLFKKHMVEKRRRNRINGSLEQLKMMVLTGLNKDPAQYEKVEKADILDLTVTYLKQLTEGPARGQQLSAHNVNYTPLMVNTTASHQLPRIPMQVHQPHQGLLQIAVPHYDVSQHMRRSVSPTSSYESYSRGCSPEPQAMPTSSKYYSKKFQRFVDSDVENASTGSMSPVSGNVSPVSGSTSPLSKVHGSDVWRPW